MVLSIIKRRSSAYVVEQRWNGSYFSRYSLREAGLTVQLGHDGDECPHAHEVITLTIIDTTGIHTVAVQFCDCANVGGSQRYVQMIRADWWPATFRLPRTGFTIRVLEFFHTLTLQSKTNGYDFYKSLVRISDGSGLTHFPVSSRSF